MKPIEQLIIALVFCGLLVVMIWIARRGRFSAQSWIGASKQPDLKLSVLSRQALTPQHTVHLVSIAGQVYIVATHPQGIQVLPHPAIEPVGERPSENGGKEAV
ncbi:MAG: flagellar biosynthetic protein FliO [Bryobacteraceae bacterium]